MIKEYVYLDEAAVFEFLEARFCCYCGLSHYEASTNYWSCPCEYDISDKNCPHNDVIEEVQKIVEETNKKVSWKLGDW